MGVVERRRAVYQFAAYVVLWSDENARRYSDRYW